MITIYYYFCLFFKAIGKRLSDIVIVGRGIYQSTSPGNAAQLYKERAYNAYLTSLQGQANS